MTAEIPPMIDRDALTLTYASEFDASAERVWQVWEDPRQLERWWGPPTWPATFDQHDLRPGAESRYYMTGPEGDRAPGWWVVDVVEPFTRIEFTDGFATADRERDTSLPVTHTEVTFAESDGRTRMTLVSRFASLDELEKLIQMGLPEGMGLALGQIEGVLASTLKR